MMRGLTTVRPARAYAARTSAEQPSDVRLRASDHGATHHASAWKSTVARGPASRSAARKRRHTSRGGTGALKRTSVSEKSTSSSGATTLTLPGDARWSCTACTLVMKPDQGGVAPP